MSGVLPAGRTIWSPHGYSPTPSSVTACPAVLWPFLDSFCLCPPHLIPSPADSFPFPSIGGATVPRSEAVVSLPRPSIQPYPGHPSISRVCIPPFMMDKNLYFVVDKIVLNAIIARHNCKPLILAQRSRGQPGLYSKFQASQGHTMSSYLKAKQTTLEQCSKMLGV